jgi:hypothetical protein
VGKILHLRFVLLCAILLLRSNAQADRVLFEQFTDDPVLARRFIQETIGTETQFVYSYSKGALKAVLDVDKSTAYYLSKEFDKITEKDNVSFSARFHVESYDGRSSPTAFLGLTTTQHVENYGDGMTMIISTRDGRLSVNASIDQGGTKVEGAPISIQLGVEYKVSASYNSITRQLELVLFTGEDLAVIVGKSTANLQEGKKLSINRFGLQNGGARVTDQTVGSITIVVDDLFMPAHGPTPISIGNQAIEEGDNGLRNLIFDVKLAFSSEQEVSVDYQVDEGSATADRDYLTLSGKLVFAPGTVIQEISVPVIGDSLIETDEMFFVKLLNPANATLKTNRAIGIILNDDIPTLTPQGISVIEGNEGFVKGTFSFKLSSPFSKPVSIEYTTVDGSATSPTDYEPQTGVIVFPPGSTTQTVVIKVFGDNTTEPSESFGLQLSNPKNCVIDKNRIDCDILNDDALPLITIGNAEAKEGDNGQGECVFKVTLSNPSSETITVRFQTKNDTALQGIDYEAKTGFVTFIPGTTNQSISIIINGDNINEPDEKLIVVLEDSSNSKIDINTGGGVILNDDPIPRLIYNNQSILEGDSQTKGISISIQLSNPSSRVITVDYRTQDQTALAGIDYESKNGRLMFLPGVVQQFLITQIIGDRFNEPNETFRFLFENPINCSLSTDNLVCSILNDDGGTIAIDDVAVTEGDKGTVLAIFNVRLSEISPQTVSVGYSTVNGTASSDVDYRPKSGTLTFPPGVISQPISITVNGDVLDEPDELFYVNLTNPQNATISKNQGACKIVDDDLPELIVQGTTVIEGDSGDKYVTIPVRLSSAFPKEISINYTIGDGLAVGGLDYITSSGKIVFPPDSTNHSITIPIVPDQINETNESFFIYFSNIENATMIRRMVEVLIIDDDPLPEITVNDIVVNEGDDGLTSAVFVLNLMRESGRMVTVEYSTRNDTAQAGVDYISKSGKVVFSPGVTNQTVQIQVISDRRDEPVERFFVSLNNQINSAIVKQIGFCDIIDDDIPEISCDDMSVSEGNVGLTEINVPIRLSSQPQKDVTVAYRTIGISATPDVDFLDQAGQLRIPAGQKNAVLSLFVKGDIAFESDETFQIVFSSPENATLLGGKTTVLIQNDDQKPEISIDDASIVEGNEGTVPLQFIVRLSAPSYESVTVSFETLNGDAVSSVDFVASNGKITIPPGSLLECIPITIVADTLGESNEKFNIILKNAENANIGKSVGEGTIVDDDAPQIRLSGVSVNEGDSEVRFADIAISLSVASTNEVVVFYNTVDGSAISGSDYIRTKGKLVIPPHSTTGTIRVAIQPDKIYESDEEFYVQISDANGAAISVSQVTVIISNDDAPPSLLIDQVEVKEGDVGQSKVDIPFHLSVASGAFVRISFRAIGDTAEVGSDFEPTSGEKTLAPGVTNGVISVIINGDIENEADETFQIFIQEISGASPPKNNCRVTIINDDPSQIVISNVTTLEGQSGITNAVFSVELPYPSNQEVRVEYFFENVSAISGIDFIGLPGVVVFPPRVTRSLITVPIMGDLVIERDEVFTVRLKNPVNATLKVSQATCLIINDDFPILTAADILVREGDTSDKDVLLKICLSAPFFYPVFVEYQTVDDTASAPLDYTYRKGLVMFPPGVTNQSIYLTINGDKISESNEVFGIIFGGHTNCVINKNKISCEILDDDPLPAVSVSDSSCIEGDFGVQKMVFIVELSNISSEVVTVEYSVASDSASNGSDFEGKTGVLVFPPGLLTQTLFINIIGDRIDEVNESFILKLKSVSHGVIGRGEAFGLIIDDDDLPEISVSDKTVVEGDSGSSVLIMPVKLSRPSSRTVRLNYKTSDVSAISGVDYEEKNGQLVFLPGVTNQVIIVNINGDTLVEENEVFRVEIYNPFNAVLIDKSAICLVLNDDGATIDFDDVSIVEGNGGIRFADLNVRLSIASSRSVSVDYFTVDNTALSPDDYDSKSGSIKFPPGSLVQKISVPINGDLIDEVNESFYIRLTNSFNATIRKDQGTVSIVDDDIPAISIVGSEVNAAGGPALIRVLVRLSSASNDEVSVDLFTVDGTATSGSDYEPRSFRLVIPPGEIQTEFTVHVRGNTLDEETEEFAIRLANPKNATIFTPSGKFFILNKSSVIAAPEISLISPLDGAIYIEGDSINIQAHLVDLDNLVSKIGIYVGDLILTNFNSQSSRVTWEHVSVGRYSITARAFGVNSLLAVSSPATIEVRSKWINRAPTLNALADVKLLQNAPSQTVGLSGIGSGAADEVQTLTITATSDNPALISSPVVTYTSPNATGSLSYQPVAGKTGKATITVTVKDDGGVLNGGQDTFTRQFTVTVAPINRAPTLNALADVKLLQNAPSQTVSLSGIGSGAVDEVQTLTITATSDNPALIANPMVTYTSPNATGTLTYQPVAGTTGKATITVTVKDDGGVLNGGQDTFTRQFTMTVAPINRAPTLNALADVKLLQNAPSQTVSLSGIGSGAVDEVQGLTVIATSDNPALIANPMVTYTSPNATGTLTYQPVAGVTGKATITVTVKDDGGVLNGGQDTFSRQFTVEVSKTENKAPEVQIVLPQDGTTTTVDVPTVLVADAKDSDGTISKVEFYKNNNQLIGTVSSSPYQLVVGNLTEGKYTFYAKATDNSGLSAVSKPITINVLGERRDVAIVKVSPDEHIDTLTKYVSEVQLSNHQDSLTWRVFEVSEISYEILSQYRVVIWNNPNPIRGVSMSEVQILKQLIDSGVPVYFIGANIATSANALELSEKRDWSRLTSLIPAGDKTQLVNVEVRRQDDHSSILDGFYGRVDSFAASDMIDQCQSITNADTLAATVDGVVFVSYPTISKPDNGETRRFSQLLPVIGKGDSRSIEERQRIFKNALCWLIDCNRCPVVNLAILADESANQSAQLTNGDPFRLKAYITTQNAECPATGIRAVAEFNGQASVLDAQTERGTVSINGGKVYFSFGRIGVHESVPIEILLKFNQHGNITNTITAFANGMTSKSVIEFSQQFVVSVSPSLAPTITADRGETGNIRLRVGGQSGIAYVIEKSTAIAGNGQIQWSTLKEIELASPEHVHIHIIEASTSSMMFRVRKK